MLVAGGTSSALNALLQVWTERQVEIQGSQEIKLSTAALSTLLASRHPALDSIQVPPIARIAVLSAISRLAQCSCLLLGNLGQIDLRCPSLPETWTSN